MKTKRQNTITQSGRAKAVLREMQKELNQLSGVLTFREFIGYEMCINLFKQRYSTFLENNQT